MKRHVQSSIGVAFLGPLVAVALGCSTTQPWTASTADAGTTARVSNALLMEDDVGGWDIDVDTEQGVVYLRGEVDSERERQTAEGLTRNVRGVRGVVNNLTVKGEPGPGDGGWDPWITTKVKSRLLADWKVRGVNVDVDTRDGVVYLSGIVANERQRTIAERHAQQTDGVRKVVSQIRLESEAYPQEAPSFSPPLEPEIEAQGPPPCPDEPSPPQR